MRSAMRPGRTGGRVFHVRDYFFIGRLHVVFSSVLALPAWPIWNE